MARFRYKRGEQPLDGYTIEHGLGVGGFGEVYYAVSDSGREVALKSLTNYEDIELRGIGHCMNLKSPHLVTIFDVKQNESEESFVIMEYVQGPSLRLLLDGSPEGLGPTKAAFFLREMAKGLSYLHEAGVVHRDLKPHNVFYEEGFVKIGDYSLCKSMSTSHRTGHTMTVGTVHYMAPEISEGRYDASVDIYALGVMLYEMLTGVPPFIGGSIGEVLMKHMTAEPDLSMIEEPFRQTIAKALAKNPEDRFASPAEMVESLFGAEHVQNSVVEFNPQELTMVANMATRKAKITPSGRAASSRPGGASWGKTWTPDADSTGTSDGDDASGPLVYKAERATPPLPPVAPTASSRRATATSPLRGAESQDRIHWLARFGIAAVVMLAISVVTSFFDNSPSPLVAPAIILCTLATLPVRQLVASRKARGLPQLASPKLLLAMAVFAPAFLVFTMSGWLGNASLGLAFFVALPFFVFDWLAITRPGRHSRMHTASVVGVFAISYYSAMLFSGRDAEVLVSAIAVGVAICSQLLATYSPAAQSATAAPEGAGFANEMPVVAVSKKVPVALGRPSAAQWPARVVGAILFMVSVILGILAGTSALPAVDLIDLETVRILSAVGFGMLIASFGLQMFGLVPGEKVWQIIVSTVLLCVVHWQCMTEQHFDAELVILIPVAVGFFAWGKRENGARI